MEKYLYFESIPQEYKNIYLGSGCSGDCYKIEGENLVYKEFRGNPPCFSNYEILLGYHSNIFVFPESLIFLKTNNLFYSLYGYIMKYIDGIDLSKLPLDTDINNLIKQLQLLEIEIREISFKRLNMCDISTLNMIYSEDKEIKVIDTDLYDLCLNDTIENLYDNMLYYSSALICLFRGADYVSKKIISLNKEYNSCICEGRFLFSKYLIDLIDYLQNQSKKDINTYGDVKDAIELVRKR